MDRRKRRLEYGRLKLLDRCIDRETVDRRMIEPEHVRMNMDRQIQKKWIGERES